MRSGNIINNIENQSYFTDTKKLEIIAEYAKFVLINNDSLIDSKYCKKEIPLKEMLILRPYYIYKTSEEILERLNKITDKIKKRVSWLLYIWLKQN